MGVPHAREWPSGEHTTEFAIDLVRGYTTGDARINGLLAKARVIAVPIVNPDGFEQSRKWDDLIDIREIARRPKNEQTGNKPERSPSLAMPTPTGMWRRVARPQGWPR